MNIFYLSPSPKWAARSQCDKHVVKMVLETAQMLCSAQRWYGAEDDHLYADTHKHHPSAVWARANNQNYKWLHEHFMYLSEEYTLRYMRRHKSAIALLEPLRRVPDGIPRGNFFTPPQCMPAEFKHPCTVTAYKAYYRHKAKTVDMRWTYPGVKPAFMGTP